MSLNTHDSEIANAADKQPTFLTAIAQVMANLHGGTTEQHAGGARRILEEAFRGLERKERAGTPSRAVHAA